ncbi:SpoIIE family protein phosphatase [Streptomyces malaysiensis]|uniref:Putative PAS/PAC sensor protein n=1 Tax=Streptomyces malaysiensis TaxID=92644 RepID=A0A7X5X5N8_STRMQ|nr:SpoIIE family protein phosphatase [Streptomyces malaysiensis]NIY67018.1 putative PAS/PAC sensor protein [Streptomyces malaysiensis]
MTSDHPGAGTGGLGGDLINQVISATADGIIAVDEQGIVRLCNPAAVELFGRPARDLLDAPFGFPIVAGHSTDVELTQPGGGVRVVEMHISATTANSHQLHVVTLRDVMPRWLAFQRLLLPTLPDLTPIQAAAVYRPAVERLGGDWYDALPLPGGAVGAMIGDVAGHSLHAAAAMAQIRNMLHALLYDRPAEPGSALATLDRTLNAIEETPITTACVARIEPAAEGWRLRWSSAGHLPPLLLTPAGTAEYLHTEPDLPLGVDPSRPRFASTRTLPKGATVIFFTDGLVERPDQSIDVGMASLAAIAESIAHLPLDELCRTLADQHPGDGHDDIAILALRIPTPPKGSR